MTKVPARIIAYTDGACIPNPGRGGWAVLFIENGKERALWGSESETTNNRMELMAAIKALENTTAGSHLEVHTDSQYLQKGIMEWMPVWKAHQWKIKGRKIANRELWERLDRAFQNHDVVWKWVRGHAGNRYNEKTDRLAKQAIFHN